VSLIQLGSGALSCCRP